MNQWRKEHTQQDLYWTYYYEWKEVMAQFQRRRRSMAPFLKKIHLEYCEISVGGGWNESSNRRGHQWNTKKQWMQRSCWEDRSAPSFFFSLYFLTWPLKCVLLLKDKWFWINKCCFLLALLNKLEKFYYWKILCKTIQTLFAIFNPTVWFLSQQPWKECCTHFNW